MLNYHPPSKLNVPFKNLTDPDIHVDKVRVRPLMFKAGIWNVNGHTSYHQGESEEPQIGTVEDWVFVNTISFAAHPFHIHLINYQIVKDYSLKKMTTSDGEQTCTYYEVDFFIKYGECLPPSISARIQEKQFDFELYSEVCKFADEVATKEMLDECFGNVKNENQFEEGISGIDVEAEIGSGPYDYSNYDGDCSLGKYRYLCENLTESIAAYNRGWKEVALIKPHRAVTVRIRWAKTDYDPKIDGSHYFHGNETELLEFPGYVYHCHFLPHEDNEMMRPFMMKPS